MRTPTRRWKTNTFVLGGLAVWAALLISCTMVNRTVVWAPHVAGATFVGAQECAQCHEEVVKGFDHATHARLIVEGENGKGLACESCHGPGSKHVQSGGEKGTIVNPGSAPESCFQCHSDKRGEFSLPHSHPVMAGKMTCTECHDPHKGNAIQGRSADLRSEKDTCTSCHTAQKGPFVFEHNAMREGCTSCHNPHGSVNQKMLVQRDSNLCLKCHLEHPVVERNGTILVGGQDHRTRMQGGTCWVSGCHEAVHGSNTNKSLRF